MTIPNLASDPSGQTWLLQKALAVVGFPIVPDNLRGPKTDAALKEFEQSLSAPAVVDGEGVVDARSEKVFAKLEPEVIPYMRRLVKLAAANGVTIVATSGLRTYAEQNALYAQGRTKPGKVVTNARGGFSSHNFGTAVDFTIFNAGNPVWESPLYEKVGAWAKSLGLSWGGDWTNADEPHVYLVPPWAKGLSESQMMTGLRKRHDDGNPIFTA